MTRLLLASAAAAAAICIPAVPATAQVSAASGFTASAGSGWASGVSVHRGGGQRLSGFPGWSDGRRGHGRHDRRDRRDHRGRDGFDVPFFYGGDWGYSDPNRSWEPDSYNDWWHERPARNTPRWVQDNDRCERMWWGGEGWRC
jgi:hypothetical protein